MTLTCVPTAIPDVLLFTPHLFGDPRGFFLETFNEAKYREFGLTRPFVQDNYSRSCAGTLRGLHYQLPHAQAKLVSVVRGAVLDVAVDVRAGSPTFGRWISQVLSEENRAQLYIPEGFAHGFCVLSDFADFTYKCTDFYSPKDDHGILWSDPQIGIAWPLKMTPILSSKDSVLPLLSQIPPAQLPKYEKR